MSSGPSELDFGQNFNGSEASNMERVNSFEHAVRKAVRQHARTPAL
jgi:hypothetical protein